MNRYFVEEFEKIAKWSAQQLSYLKRKFNVNDEEFSSMLRRASGKTSVTLMSDEEREAVARLIVAKHIKPLKGKKSKKPAKSDIARAADRKKLLIGVKREKGALKLDLMKRIKKKTRLSVKPFKAIRKSQRNVRLGLVRGNRSQARKGYKTR